MKQRHLAWLLFLLGILFTRLDYFEDVIYNIDEAEYAVAAHGLDHGLLPGVDFLGTTKPPGIALLYQLLFDLFGRSMLVLHVAHVVIVIASGFLLIELAIALWGFTAAVPAALLYWMLLSSWNLPHEIIALNVESPGVLFLLFALLLAWTRRNLRWALLAAGLAIGTATIFRQSFLAFLIPIIYAVTAGSERKSERLAWLALGMVLVWLPVLLLYTAKGALNWAWDSWVRYPFTYSGDTGFLGFLEAFYLNTTEFALYAVVPLAFGLYGLWMLWRERKSSASEFLLLLFAAALIALASGSRFFGHYWLQLFPALALVGVPAWLNLARGKQIVRWLLYAAVAVGSVLAAIHFPLWRTWDPYAVPRGVSYWRLGKEQSEKRVGAFARENTRPDETIVVWGYCPQIYYHAERLPGVRDFLCHYITGYSPGTFDPFSQRAIRPYGHPRAERMFIEDLERNQPKYIFDLVQVDDYTFPFLQYSLRIYPDLAAYLQRHYLPEGQIDDVFVYRRRTAADSWWPDETDVD